MLILKIVVAAPLAYSFDYLAPPGVEQQQLQPGIRVKVPFRNKEVVGILVDYYRQTAKPTRTLKQALELLDQQPLLNTSLLQLLSWASDYYHYPLGEVLVGTLPSLLRQGKPALAKVRRSLAPGPVPDIPPQLNAAQLQAINQVTQSAHRYHAFALYGVTGSGKTEVYLQLIDWVLSNGWQALVLVPEISLTPQTLARFQQRFDAPMVSLHSGLTARERLNAWVAASEGTAKIVLGTRSAVFTPMPKLGLIIIDEEHDLSFKQQEGFRYSARDVAVMRAHLEQLPIILGSATPSLETLYNVASHRYQLLQLPERAGSAQLPKICLLDIRNQVLTHGLSLRLLDIIKAHLAKQNQVLLFLNRRGYAPTLLCHSCAWVAQCHRCEIALTLHHAPKSLRCHHCDSQQRVPHHCPVCQSSELMPLGQGTEQLELALADYFPNIPISRIDRDTTRRKGSLQTMLAEIHQGGARILIGTQMLAKGHHFPGISLVAIVNLDSGLYSADFRATERTAQLLMQVAGRAGRANQLGEVWIQTHQPEHPLFQQLLTQGYWAYAQTLLAERAIVGLPPYQHLALIRAEAPHMSAPLAFLTEVKALGQTLANSGLNLLGPIPAPMPKRAGRYRAQLLLQAQQRPHLQEALKLLAEKITLLKSIKRVRWSLDVDPQELF